MYGVMLAVVARKRELRLELVDLDRGRSKQRAVERGEAPQQSVAARRGYGAGRAEIAAQLRVELGVAGLEDADERTLAERLADGLDLRELAAPPEDLEKGRRTAARPG